jgi:aminoglycoside phosphotransferase (APT) family kinase protein
METAIVINDLCDIPSYRDWTKIEPVNKGWSKDKKYYIEDCNGKKLLLRVSELDTYDNKKLEFEKMQEVNSFDISMSVPIDFGICGDGKYVYSLLTWLDGTAVDEVIRLLSNEEQYKLGIEAGRILKKIHSIPAPMGQQDWEQRMVKKISYHVERYKTCGIKVKNDNHALQYIYDNLYHLKNRSQTYQHGDFHVGNLILGVDNTLGVIDFNRWDYGDPYEEFYKMMLFSRELSIPFAVGQINGYFDNIIPDDFFDLLALYLADVILFSIVWAMPFGTDDVNGMIKRAEMILTDFDNFKVTIPKWFNKKKQ